MSGKQTKAFSDSFDALLTSMLKQNA
jgi:hypothetical protein